MMDSSQRNSEKKREVQYSMLIADIVSDIQDIENLRRIYIYAEALLSKEHSVVLSVNSAKEADGILKT